MTCGLTWVNKPKAKTKKEAAMINWNATAEDIVVIVKIAKRVSEMATSMGGKYPILEANMDVSATHLNGCSLKLEELLAADDFNFGHDVFGIRQNINRETGKLENCFLPRFATC